MVTVRYYAAARAAAGIAEESVIAATVPELRAVLASRHEPGLAAVLGVSTLMYDGRPLGADALLADLPAGAVIEVLPPFAGG